MDLLADVTSRLAVLDVPILHPDQREVPAQGRKPGQPGGLTGYLTSNPGGYVQVNDTQSAFVDDVKAVQTVTLQVVAPPAVARVLADRVIAALHYRPERPTPYRLLSDGPVKRLDAPAMLITLAFKATQFIPR